MNDKTTTIRKKNDLFRQTFIGGKVVMTPMVIHSADREAIITAIRSFTSFNEDNDPYGEHDFGSVSVNGQSYYFKIDYYDPQYMGFLEDGNRVMTIMHCSEY